jgi:hypothetical protein
MSLGSESQTRLQFSQRFPRGALREKRGMNFLGRVRAGTTNDDPLAILFPLQD